MLYQENIQMRQIFQFYQHYVRRMDRRMKTVVKYIHKIFFNNEICVEPSSSNRTSTFYFIK